MKNLDRMLENDPDYWRKLVEITICDAKENDQANKELWERLESVIRDGDLRALADGLYNLNQPLPLEKL